jgi:ankyrin repeat protein
MKRAICPVAASLLLAASSYAASNNTPVKDTRLIDALKRRDVKAFNTLMAQHADVNAALPDGSTPLSWAAFLDLKEPAEKLIASGANVNAPTEYGETPLTLALANGDVPLVQQLLKGGADPKVARWNGETSLMIAAGTGSAEEVKLLLDRGVDVNAAEMHKGQNALMWAAAEGHRDVMDLLIHAGAKVNNASKTGATPLVFAVTKNDGPSVELLLVAGADPNFAMPDGTKVLAVATTAKSTKAALVLLDHGADPNAADKAGNTPLHVAAQIGSLDMVEKLLSKKVNLEAKTNKTKPAGITPGPRAQAGEYTPLLLAARFARVDVMRVLIKAGADTHAKAQDGTTLFLAAASSSRVEAAKLAFEYDKDINAMDDQHSTAMHLLFGGAQSGATQTNMTEMAQYLADVGVPLDELDARGRTPCKAGDGAPFDKPIQRIAEIIYARGGTPKYVPKEFVMPKSLAGKVAVPAATTEKP